MILCFYIMVIIMVNLNWKFVDFKCIYVELKYNFFYDFILNLNDMYVIFMIIVFYIYFGDVG